MTALTGSCQCGAVRFTLAQRPTDPTACHCVQCRKQSGHFFASANVAKSALERHIFVAEKGDYYRIADGLPQRQR